MGCDIHMAIEVRKDGRWTWKPDAVMCADCSGSGKYRDGSPCFCAGRYRQRTAGRDHGYSDRNYDAFGVLANVRNGTWGEKTAFISEPRGLPSDRDPALRYDDEHETEYNLGDHSFTHVTLAELVAFDWTRPVFRNAIIGWEQFKKWDRVSSPGSYCAGAGNVISQEDAERDAAAGNEPAEYRNVRVRWRETLAEAVGNFHAGFIPQLVALAESEGVGADDVRCVFGFDS